VSDPDAGAGAAVMDPGTLPGHDHPLAQGCVKMGLAVYQARSLAAPVSYE